MILRSKTTAVEVLVTLAFIFIVAPLLYYWWATAASKYLGGFFLTLGLIRAFIIIDKKITNEKLKD